MVKKMRVSVLWLALLAAGSVLGQAPSGAAPESVSAPAGGTQGAPAKEASPYKKAGVGCAAGMVLGSVVPGVGNLVGCVVGGLFGWWR